MHVVGDSCEHGIVLCRATRHSKTHCSMQIPGVPLFTNKRTTTITTATSRRTYPTLSSTQVNLSVKKNLVFLLAIFIRSKRKFGLFKFVR